MPETDYFSIRDNIHPATTSITLTKGWLETQSVHEAYPILCNEAKPIRGRHWISSTAKKYFENFSHASVFLLRGNS